MSKNLAKVKFPLRRDNIADVLSVRLRRSERLTLETGWFHNLLWWSFNPKTYQLAMKFSRFTSSPHYGTPVSMENLSFVPSVDLPVTSTATISNTTVTRTGCIFAIFICTFDNEIQHYIRLKENNSASNNKRARNSTAGFSSSIYRVQFQEETRRHRREL